MRPVAHIMEQLRRKDEKAALFDGYLAAELRFLIRQLSIVKTLITRGAFLTVDVITQVFRDEAVEKHPENIRLEIPAVDTAPQIICDAPNSFMQLCALRILRHGALVISLLIMR